MPEDLQLTDREKESMEELRTMQAILEERQKELDRWHREQLERERIQRQHDKIVSEQDYVSKQVKVSLYAAIAACASAVTAIVVALYQAL